VNRALAARSLPELDAAEYACVLDSAGLGGFELGELIRRDPEYRDVFAARKLASAHVGCIDHLKVLVSAPSQEAVRACADTFPPPVAVATYLATLIADARRLEGALSVTASCLQEEALLSTPEGPLVLYLRDRELAYLLDREILACATPLVPVLSGTLPASDGTASSVASALNTCLPDEAIVSLMAVSAPAEESCVAEQINSLNDLPRQVLEAYLRKDERTGLALLEGLRKACPLDGSTQPSTIP
jgi:hypothetical protein